MDMDDDDDDITQRRQRPNIGRSPPRAHRRPAMPAAPASAAASDAADAVASSGAGGGSSSSASASSAALDALARSNLLRLASSELIEASHLRIRPDGDSVRAHGEARWAPSARGYVACVRSVVKALGRTTLSPDVAKVSSVEGGGDEEAARYRVPLKSDKFVKSLEDGAGHPWTFPFGGGSCLTLVPTGSFAHFGNAGLATKSANGGSVPVLDVAVLVGDEDFAGGKDYLNHRYADKRNVLAVHVAKQLSQKKHRSKVGTVHLVDVFGDASKVGLLLTPPLDGGSGGGGPSEDGKKKKRKRGGEGEGEDESNGKAKKGGKARFRVRLLFGIARDGRRNPPSGRRRDDEDDDEDDASEGASAPTSGCWIPPSRLLPDRANNRRSEKPGEGRSDDDGSTSTRGTPHYTNSLAEDVHLLSTVELINETLASLSPAPSSGGGGGSDAAHSPSVFHETLLLSKVWALQRGFLRGHDAFTTTTLAVVLAYLFRTKAVGRRTGSVQAFATFLKFWSETDWLGDDAAPSPAAAGGESSAAAVRARRVARKAARVIPREGKSEARTIASCAQARLYLDDVRKHRNRRDEDGERQEQFPPTLLELYKDAFASRPDEGRHVDAPVLLDPTMTINYLARMSPSFVRESRAEARRALKIVHGGGARGGGGGDAVGDRSSAFRELFLERRRFWTRYDAYVRVPLARIPKRTGGDGGRKGRGKGREEGDGRAPEAWGNDADDLGRDESVRRGVVEVLARALGDRATIVRALTSGNGEVGGVDATRSGKGGGDPHDVMAESDQLRAVPIRGVPGFSDGHAARPSERAPAPPVAPPPSTQPSGRRAEPCLVVGLRLDPDASRRIVDRGPPAEDVEGAKEFMSLWGERKAQLRRFRDGAIVRAVVWDDDDAGGDASSGAAVARYCGAERSAGGVAERIVRHVVALHFAEGGKGRRGGGGSPPVAFELRDVVSFVDGAAAGGSSSPRPPPFADSLALHKRVMTAFESLANFLRRNTATTIDRSSSGDGKKASNLGLPLSIDEVEPLSPCLRYSALFPPVPHPLLGADGSVDQLFGSSGDGAKRKVSGANVGAPILVQIRFEGSSKWPTSLNAMGAAKCAMLVRLADGIEEMKRRRSGDEDLDAFEGRMDVALNRLDLGYRGYSWRIVVRADQELRMLRSLRNPTEEAKALRSFSSPLRPPRLTAVAPTLRRQSLIDRHVRGAVHHSLVRAVHTRHPSASSVVRLARRWAASHLLSDHVPHEAVELLVASVYAEATATSEEETTRGPRGGLNVDAPPSTAVAGFRRFLRLLASHDWAREPLIVDPQNHISHDDQVLIHAQFKAVRGPEYRNGPAMYIIAPTDYDGVEDMSGSKVVGEGNVTSPQTALPANATEKTWAPTVTAKVPERVVLSRAAALARRSLDHLLTCITTGEVGNSWVAAFQESSASLTSYSALLRVDPSYVIDPGCSSTNADCAIIGAESKLGMNDQVQTYGPFERSLQKRYAGPKQLRKKHYTNLVLEKDTLHEWQPVKTLVNALRLRYGEYAIFFYSEFAPDVIAVLWRPDAFKPRPFSAAVSEFKRPVTEPWTGDSLVITNANDLIQEIGHYSRNIVSNIKVWT
ncbi:hypothetical protein ACHAWF_011614 [Thalassiosira exigua]